LRLLLLGPGLLVGSGLLVAAGLFLARALLLGGLVLGGLVLGTFVLGALSLSRSAALFLLPGSPPLLLLLLARLMLTPDRFLTRAFGLRGALALLLLPSHAQALFFGPASLVLALLLLAGLVSACLLLTRPLGLLGALALLLLPGRAQALFLGPCLFLAQLILACAFRVGSALALLVFSTLLLGAGLLSALGLCSPAALLLLPSRALLLLLLLAGLLLLWRYGLRVPGSGLAGSEQPRGARQKPRRRHLCLPSARNTRTSGSRRTAGQRRIAIRVEHRAPARTALGRLALAIRHALRLLVQAAERVFALWFKRAVGPERIAPIYHGPP
jgi:hypothetical protein